jgi:hypothetical protein
MVRRQAANISDSRFSASMMARLVTAYATKRLSHAVSASHGGSEATADAAALSWSTSST